MAHKMHYAQDRTVLTLAVKSSLQKGFLLTHMAEVLQKRLEQKSLVSVGTRDTATFVHQKENSGTKVVVLAHT